MPEQRAVTIRVGTLCIVEVAHGLVGHEERRHRADALDAAVRRQSGREARAALLELLVHGRVAETPQYREPGRGGERGSRQSPGLIDVAARREPAPDLGPAA